MHYYTFSSLIFADGKIRDGGNFIFRSEKPSTVIEFKKSIAGNHAGPKETYSAIMIPTWQEIDEATYNHIEEGFGKE